LAGGGGGGGGGPPKFALGRFDAKVMVEALNRLYGEIRNQKSE
jgi:hypothetical protein